jgi:hypothetical protein
MLSLLAPLLMGCGGDRGDVDMGGEDLGPDRFAVESREGEVKMGLTDQAVYFALTDSAAERARAEVEEDLEGKEGLGGLIGGVVSTAVTKALGFRVKYPIESIRDIRWADGGMVVILEDGGRRLDQDMLKVDDRPVTEAFDREAVEAFAAEFRKAKSELEAARAP